MGDLNSLKKCLHPVIWPLRGPESHLRLTENHFPVSWNTEPRPSVYLSWPPRDANTFSVYEPCAEQSGSTFPASASRPVVDAQTGLNVKFKDRFPRDKSELREDQYHRDNQTQSRQHNSLENCRASGRP